jgi:hypothetical protein
MPQDLIYGEGVKILDMKYFYYRLWKIFSGIPTNDTPAINAMILLSCIHCVNIVAFIICVNHFIKINAFYLNKNELITCSTVFALSMFTINYFLLYKKREVIAEKYKNESNRLKILGTIFLCLYMIVSFVLVYVVSKMFPVG